jgi:DNA-binding NarL/FixJ family response regulator
MTAYSDMHTDRHTMATGDGGPGPGAGDRAERFGEPAQPATDTAVAHEDTSPSERPVSARVIDVGIINDYEVVVRGLAAMLAPYRDRIRVVELDTGGVLSGTADVALFDTFAGRRHTLARAAEMVRAGRARHIVLYTWDAAPQFVRAAKEIGVSGVILKTRSADVLVDSIERIVAGERVGFELEHGGPAGPRLVDLSDRESEVLALIAKGLTNAQIADELYLSIETVKTYVKRLYAKLDVHNRAQAAVAAASHQLTPRDAG